MWKTIKQNSTPFLRAVTKPKTNRLVYITCLLYLLSISLFMVWHRVWFSPDQFFLGAILAALFIGGLGRFLKDWAPFILLFLSYEFLRGLAPILNNQVHITEMIAADKFMFGYVPAVALQKALYHPNAPQWYDFMASFLYMAHFIVPMLTAFLFWLVSKKTFREFTLALIILSFAAFGTYVLYPAMPPWLAANNGYLPQLPKIMDQIVVYMGHPIALPTLYSLFRGDEVAAMPSLHAAFPLLVTLFFTRLFKWCGLLLVPYVLGVWFSVVYLGEHYAIDVLFGAIYAVVAFILVINLERVNAKHHSKRLLRAVRILPAQVE